MEKAHRLSIFNSKYLFPLIILSSIIGVSIIECIYFANNVPADHGDLSANVVKNDTIDKAYIIGDSRALSGISSDEINSITHKYSFYNLASAGSSVFSQFERMNSFPHPKSIIICVTPANVFGVFTVPDNKPNIEILQPIIDKIFRIHVPKYPIKFIESFFSEKIKNCFRFSYGFDGLTDLIMYGEISTYKTKTGWLSHIDLGSDERFGKMVNFHAYNEVVLETYFNKSLINSCKLKLDSLLSNTLSLGIKILVVRIPVSKDILTIENQKFPWFDSYIYKVCNMYKINYCNKIEGFQYPNSHCDGSHLPYLMARKYSRSLAIKYFQFFN